MSGNRGFLSKAQSLIINREFAEIDRVSIDDRNGYFQAVSNLVFAAYKSFDLPTPKIYRFSSPLGCMLALSTVMKRESKVDDEMMYTINDLRNILGNSRPRPEVCPAMTQALSLHSDEQISEIFEEWFAREMMEQCGESVKAVKKLMEGFNPDWSPGKLWWQAVAPGTWIWPYNKFAIICDRPVRCDLDDRKRPHREDDAAIEFADGYRVWVWHGVLVPKRIILFPESLHFKDVENEKNLEIRRIIIERMGHKRYLEESEAVLEDMDTLTHEGSAPRALMRDKLGNKWLVGTDGSTSRVYTMSVPAHVRTCKEAHEEIAGFDESRLIAEA